MRIFFTKAVLIGIILYFLHIGSLLILKRDPSAYISGFGIFIYGMAFALWGYILIGGFILVGQKKKNCENIDT